MTQFTTFHSGFKMIWKSFKDFKYFQGNYYDKRFVPLFLLKNSLYYFCQLSSYVENSWGEIEESRGKWIKQSGKGREGNQKESRAKNKDQTLKSFLSTKPLIELSLLLIYQSPENIRYNRDCFFNALVRKFMLVALIILKKVKTAKQRQELERSVLLNLPSTQTNKILFHKTSWSRQRTVGWYFTINGTCQDTSRIHYHFCLIKTKSSYT